MKDESKLYVSPVGNDAWSGRIPEPAADGADGPVATVRCVCDLARALVARGLAGPVTVYLREGCYFQDATIELDASMSGTETCPVTFASYPGEKAVISGGRRITGWRRLDGNLWVANIGSNNPLFRTFRAGPTLAVRARYPSYDPSDPVRSGWLFADWWGKPWELGRFDLPLITATKAGDWVEWTADVPRAATYRVWLRYVKTEHEKTPVSSTFGARGGAVAQLEPLGVTGPWHAFTYVNAGSVELVEGTQKLVWENTSGGDIHLDAIVLCSDPQWDPARQVRIVGWHTREYEVDEPPAGHSYLLLQAEAATAVSEGVVLPTPPGFRSPGSEPPGKRDRIHLRPGDMPQWENWEGAEVHIFPAWGWNNKTVPVSRVDREKGIIHADFGDDIRPGNRFFISGVREALTEPGEWHLDAATGTIWYMGSQDAVVTEGVAAMLKTVLRLSGRHIRLRDLVISDADYTAPGTGEAYEVDGAIVVSGAECCEISGCRFENANGWGVSLVHRSNRILIERNVMRGLGQGGVVLSGDDATQPYENTIVANVIEDCGRVYKHVAGVCAASSSRNRIAHNRIHRMPRYGITLKSPGGRASHDNVVEYNDLRDLNLETSDTGAIEIYGSGQKFTGNIVRHNAIVNSVGLKMNPRGEFMSPFYTWGVYMDDWASGCTIQGNLIVDNVVGGVNMHGGWDNLIENNIMVNGLDRQISLSPIFSDLSSMTLRNNIIRRNVIAYRRAESDLIWCRPNRWYPEILKECDYNLYWCFTNPDLENPAASPTPVGSFQKWRALGFDQHSIMADPHFVDPAAMDYSLQDDSPAYRLGFQRIPVERIGPAGYES